jgi:hypothetical protein
MGASVNSFNIADFYGYAFPISSQNCRTDRMRDLHLETSAKNPAPHFACRPLLFAEHFIPPAAPRVSFSPAESYT